MELNELHDNKGATKGGKRVGRGIGSGKGKTCGRGGKGQTARSGVAINGFEGGQMPIYRRLPKRGFNNVFRRRFAIVNLGRLQKAVDTGKLDPVKRVTVDSLLAAGIVTHRRDGVRLLAQGELRTGLVIEVTAASQTAREAVARVGGQVLIMMIRRKTPVPSSTA